MDCRIKKANPEEIDIRPDAGIEEVKKLIKQTFQFQTVKDEDITIIFDNNNIEENNTEPWKISNIGDPKNKSKRKIEISLFGYKTSDIQIQLQDVYGNQISSLNLSANGERTFQEIYEIFRNSENLTPEALSKAKNEAEKYRNATKEIKSCFENIKNLGFEVSNLNSIISDSDFSFDDRERAGKELEKIKNQQQDLEFKIEELKEFMKNYEESNKGFYEDRTAQDKLFDFASSINGKSFYIFASGKKVEKKQTLNDFNGKKVIFKLDTLEPNTLIINESNEPESEASLTLNCSIRGKNNIALKVTKNEIIKFIIKKLSLVNVPAKGNAVDVMRDIKLDLPNKEPTALEVLKNKIKDVVARILEIPGDKLSRLSYNNFSINMEIVFDDENDKISVDPGETKEFKVIFKKRELGI